MVKSGCSCMSTMIVRYIQNVAVKSGCSCMSNDCMLYAKCRSGHLTMQSNRGNHMGMQFSCLNVKPEQKLFGVHPGNAPSVVRMLIFIKGWADIKGQFPRHWC